jgi:hypothetical protein
MDFSSSVELAPPIATERNKLDYSVSINFETTLSLPNVLVHLWIQVKSSIQSVQYWNFFFQYRNKGTWSGIEMLQYRTEIPDARLPMPMASASMPSYGKYLAPLQPS